MGCQLSLVVVASFIGQVERVSIDSSGIEGQGASDTAAISADGSVIAFVSLAANLVAADTNGFADVFVRDRVLNGTTRVSVDSTGQEPNGESDEPAVSPDGHYVAFVNKATNLVAGDTNGRRDVFLHDRVLGTTHRVSVSSTGSEADRSSVHPGVSTDGRYVVFSSSAKNLVPGDLNNAEDVFVHEVATGVTVRLSVGPGGSEANGGSSVPVISGDGRSVAFTSVATNLVPGDTNGYQDVFVHDRDPDRNGVFDEGNGIVVRMSVSSGGAEADGACVRPALSLDGRWVAFDSKTTKLVSGYDNSFMDVFLHDRDADEDDVWDEGPGVTTQVSIDVFGGPPQADCTTASVSAGGRYVTFQSKAQDLTEDARPYSINMFARDLRYRRNRVVSMSLAGVPGGGTSGMIAAHVPIVAFASMAADLVGSDRNGVSDVFVGPAIGPADWHNYGAGWPGTFGVPALFASEVPRVGKTLTIAIGNSLRADTQALLVVGAAPANLPTPWDGNLLVVAMHWNVLVVPGSGLAWSLRLDDDPNLVGATVDLQALEVDAGASRGLSYSRGLELHIGW